MANAKEGNANSPDGRIRLPRRVAAGRASVALGPPASRVLADTVKQMILKGELALGAPVTEKWLTERFDVSRPTVREALSLLVAERYLDQEPYKSARVRTYSTDQVVSMLDARRLLEGHAADRCDRATDESRARLRASFAAYASETSSNRRDAAAMAHVDLHVAMVGLAGSKELETAEHDLMIGTLLLVDLINWRLQDAEKMYMEHLRLVTALLEPDPQEARRLSDAHVDVMVAAVYRQLPDPSVPVNDLS